MQKIDNDAFYEYIKQYDSDSEYHFIGTVEFHLLCDDKPYEGMNSHREALRFLFDWLVEKSIEDKENARIILGNNMAEQLHPLVLQLLIPKEELLFDAANSKGLELANKYVKQTENTDAQMYFSVGNPKELADCTNIGLIEVTGFFAEALKSCKRLKLITRIYMYFADKLSRTKIIHLSF